MGLFPGSKAPPVPSYLPPCVPYCAHLLPSHCNRFLWVPGNPAWERREGSPNVCKSNQPRTPVLPPLLLNSTHLWARDAQFSEPRCIYSEPRRGCSTSITTTWAAWEESWLNLRARKSRLHRLAGTIPRMGTRRSKT